MGRTDSSLSTLKLGKLPAEHPLLHTTAMAFHTPMVNALLNEVTYWLYQGIPGGFVIGHSRAGKSKALELIAPDIRDRQGQSIPYRKIYIGDRNANTVKFVWRAMCRSSRIPIKRNAVTDDYVDQYTTSILEEMQEKEAKQLVLLVDEAQRLQAPQFNAFAELYDMLEMEGKHLTTIFFGNIDECATLFESFSCPDFNHVRGRFGVRLYKFTGVSDHKSCKACLSAYDNTRFPASNGPTYTEICLPKRYKSGWRLASLSQEVWAAYSEKVRIGKHVPTWPMAYFVATINVLLLDYLPRFDVLDNDLVCESIEQSLQASNVLEFLINPARKAS